MEMIIAIKSSYWIQSQQSQFIDIVKQHSINSSFYYLFQSLQLLQQS